MNSMRRKLLLGDGAVPRAFSQFSRMSRSGTGGAGRGCRPRPVRQALALASSTGVQDMELKDSAEHGHERHVERGAAALAKGEQSVTLLNA